MGLGITLVIEKIRKIKMNKQYKKILIFGVGISCAGAAISYFHPHSALVEFYLPMFLFIGITIACYLIKVAVNIEYMVDAIMKMDIRDEFRYNRDRFKDLRSACNKDKDVEEN